MKSFDETWEVIHSTTEWGQYPTESVIRFVARNYYSAQKRENVKILDFGCGGGAHTWYVAREGFDAYAFDGSKSAIEKLRKRLESEKLTADLRVLDGTEIDYEDSFFDAVIDNVCIYGSTVGNITVMYNQVYRILKSGGKLFTSCFTKNTSGYETGEEIEPDTYINIKEGNIAGRGMTHFFTAEGIKNVLENVGFCDIITEPYEYVDKGNCVSMLITHACKR